MIFITVCGVMVLLADWLGDGETGLMCTHVHAHHLMWSALENITKD